MRRILEKPPFLSGNANEQVSALRDYTVRLVKSLEEVIDAVSAGAVTTVNTSGSQKAGGGSSARSATVEEVMKNASELKSLIAKSAENMQKQIDNIEATNFFVKYADDFSGSYPAEMYNAPRSTTVYMGTCTATSSTAPTAPSAYSWARIKGATGEAGRDGAPGKDGAAGKDGEDGQDGAPGKDGQDGAAGKDGADGRGISSTTITYGVSNSASVMPESWTPTAPQSITKGYWLWVKTYIVYTDNTDSTSYTKSYIGTDGQDGQDGKDGKDGEDGQDGAQGQQGIQGPPGSDGRTTYLHIKYSDDGETFTGNDGEDLGAYIGMYTDYTEADSSTFSDYTWHRFADDTELMAAIESGDNAVMQYADSKITEYNSLYVAKSEFGTFQESINTTIENTAKGVVESYDYGSAIESVQANVDLMQAYYTSINGEIRRGIIEDPDNPGQYITGIAIAQALKFSGECGPSDQNNPGDGYTYYYMVKGQTFGLYTSTGWQFWIDGVKRGWFNSEDGMLHVANIYIENALQLGAHWKIDVSGTALRIDYVE